MQAIVDKMRSDFFPLNIGVFGSKALLNRTSRFGPATLAVRTFEKHFLSVMSGVGSSRVILSVCLSLLHPVPYCRTDINLRQLSFLKMFLVSIGWGLSFFIVCCFARRRSTCVFLLLQMFSDVVWRPGISIAGQLIVSVSPRF